MKMENINSFGARLEKPAADRRQMKHWPNSSTITGDFEFRAPGMFSPPYVCYLVRQVPDFHFDLGPAELFHHAGEGDIDALVAGGAVSANVRNAQPGQLSIHCGRLRVPGNVLEVCYPQYWMSS